MKKCKIYLGSGWFTPNQREVIGILEEMLRHKDNIEHYFPRHDGVKLTPNEFHDHKLRESVFNANVENIKSADYVLANFDSRDGFYDTGTTWEAAYAAAHGIPVISMDPAGKFIDRMSGISNQFKKIFYDYESLDKYLDNLTKERRASKVLFIGPEDTESQVKIGIDLVSLLSENCGTDIRWVNTKEGILDNPDIIFEDVEYMVAVIDDRHPTVSWMMGQAYEKNIPIITYTNHDYTVNLMLLFSIVAHCQGKDQLKEVVQFIKRNGLKNLPPMDTTSMKAE